MRGKLRLAGFSEVLVAVLANGAPGELHVLVVLPSPRVQLTLVLGEEEPPEQGSHAAHKARA